jgi:hypothetical protein
MPLLRFRKAAFMLLAASIGFQPRPGYRGAEIPTRHKFKKRPLKEMTE